MKAPASTKGMADHVEIGRLAMREEGENWNAYYMLPDSQEGALFLGSVRMALIVGHPGRKEAFIELMRGAVSDFIEHSRGVRPTWGGLQKAPANERTREG